MPRHIRESNFAYHAYFASQPRAYHNGSLEWHRQMMEEIRAGL